MGLALEVGILADLKENDAEGFEYHAGALQRLNSFLTSRGLQEHTEPSDCEVWSGEMIGYSGLHDVRRIAAYVDSGQPLPEPSTRDSAKDACLDAYYAAADGKRPALFARLFGSVPKFRRGFDHLIVHSDAEGYYLPFDFDEVLFPPGTLEIPGGMIGSASRLLAEIERLAQVLAIPVDTTADSEKLWQVADEPLPEGDLWQRYGRESFGCVMLREACRKAIAAGAALVFT